jgi:hypothetical protein
VRVALVAALLVAVVSSTSVSAAGTRAPALRVVDLTPITVRGTGFRPGERVRLVLTADSRHVRTVLAGGAGGFIARFGAVYEDYCARFQLRATGSSGAVAVTVRKPPLSCAAPDPVP